MSILCAPRRRNRTKKKRRLEAALSNWFSAEQFLVSLPTFGLHFRAFGRQVHKARQELAKTCAPAGAAESDRFK